MTDYYTISTNENVAVQNVKNGLFHTLDQVSRSDLYKAFLSSYLVSIFALCTAEFF